MKEEIPNTLFYIFRGGVKRYVSDMWESNNGTAVFRYCSSMWDALFFKDGLSAEELIKKSEDKRFGFTLTVYPVYTTCLEEKIKNHLQIMNSILPSEIKENQSIEVRKKYFVSGGCSFVDFYFQLLFGNTSRLKKEYFTIGSVTTNG